MDENQNFGYNDGSYNNQGADARQQYGQNEQPFMSAPQNEQPYANGQSTRRTGRVHSVRCRNIIRCLTERSSSIISRILDSR